MIHKGSDGYAGEVGHTTIVKNGRLCGCGHRGCLETYTAAKGIVTTAQEVMAESDAPSLMRSVEKLSPKIIAQCCNQGDELAIEVFRRTGMMLGLGLAELDEDNHDVLGASVLAWEVKEYSLFK